MVGWHHRLNRHEFEQAWGDGDGQRGLACCSARGHKELDTTEGLNSSTSFNLHNRFHYCCSLQIGNLCQARVGNFPTVTLGHQILLLLLFLHPYHVLEGETICPR